MSLDQTLLRAGVQMSSLSPGPGLNQEITETPQIKEEPEEQSIKQEEEQLPVSVPESTAVCVKTEESSLLQQRQTEHEEETQGDVSSERGTYDIYETCSTDIGAQGKKRKCPFCKKIYYSRQGLKLHLKVHTGEILYSCSYCEKTFIRKDSYDRHMRTHTAERLICLACGKSFACKSSFQAHLQSHTGEKKTYRCSVCHKAFPQKSFLRSHRSTHIENTTFGCSDCGEIFKDRLSFRTHVSVHRPFSCSLCDRAFKQKAHLESHAKWHNVPAAAQTGLPTGLILLIVTPDNPVDSATVQGGSQ